METTLLAVSQFVEFVNRSESYRFKILNKVVDGKDTFISTEWVYRVSIQGCREYQNDALATEGVYVLYQNDNWDNRG